MERLSEIEGIKFRCVQLGNDLMNFRQLPHNAETRLDACFVLCDIERLLPDLLAEVGSEDFPEALEAAQIVEAARDTVLEIARPKGAASSANGLRV